MKITLLEVSKSVMDSGSQKNSERGDGVVLCASHEMLAACYYACPCLSRDTLSLAQILGF